MGHYYLGCDVSKGYADFVILNQERKEIVPVFQLDDTFEGHSCLHELLITFFREHPEAELFVGAESTGGLENNWLRTLVSLSSVMNIKVARLNPSGIKALYDASLTRNINDGISARTIAEYMITYPDKIVYDVDDPYYEVRRHWNYIEMLKKQRVQLINQLHILLYSSFPFLVRYCNKGIPGWVYELILKYPSSDSLSRARLTSVSKIRYISKKRAEELISEAKNNVGCSEESVSFIIKSLLSQILYLKELISRQENYLKRYKDLPAVKLLMTFKGIGLKSAIGIILHIVDISRFPTVKSLVSYFGVHPVYKKSGDNTFKYCMSKKGKASMRYILYMIVYGSTVHNPILKEVYAKQLSKGKCRMSALGVCMHKTLRIIYGMLKNNKPFDPEIDKRNREKGISQGQSIDSVLPGRDKKRRFQEFDEMAPVSRRQSIKRKKRKTSQSLDEAKYGIVNSPSS